MMTIVENKVEETFGHSQDEREQKTKDSDPKKEEVYFRCVTQEEGETFKK